MKQFKTKKWILVWLLVIPVMSFSQLSDLSGYYTCDDGGQYFIRHEGSKVWWFGEHSSGNWAVVLIGNLTGRQIHGNFYSIPKGGVRSEGALTLSVSADGHTITKTSSRGIYGGSHWQKATMPANLIPSRTIGGFHNNGDPGDISGIWRGSDGGIYYIHQHGGYAPGVYNNIAWFGEKAFSSGKPDWSNIAYGGRNGDNISLKWLDTPKGSTLGSGELKLKILNCNELILISGTGGFGGNKWQRELFTNCGTSGSPGSSGPTEVVLDNISVMAVEVNQSVRGFFETDIPEEGTITLDGDVPMLPGKATLVRFYLGQDAPTLGNIQGKLLLTVPQKYGNGSSSYTIESNLLGEEFYDKLVSVSSTTSPSEKARKLVEMRAELRKTMNFVIDGDLIENAPGIQFSLYVAPDNGSLIGAERISPRINVDFDPPAYMGITYYRLLDKNIEPLVAPTEEHIKSEITSYLRASYPVSYIDDSRGLKDIFTFIPKNKNRSYWDKIFGKNKGKNPYRRLLYQFNKELIGLYTPYNTSPNWVNMAIGIAGPSLGSQSELSGGVAIRRAPTNNKNRNYMGTLLTVVMGWVAAHEVGHMFGLKHAGKAHDECGGGACEDFIHINGTRDVGNSQSVFNYETYGLYADFGINISQLDNKKWNVKLIDPCPVSTPYQRSPCIASILSSDPNPIRSFDIMSYGQVNPWWSSYNYRRIYQGIVDWKDPYTNRLGTQDDSLETVMLMSGYLSADTGFVHDSYLRTMYPSQVDIFQEQNGNSHQLQIRDKYGDLLFKQSFSPDTASDEMEEHPIYGFSILIPADLLIHTVRVLDHEGKELFVQTASNHPPKVNMENIDLVASLDSGALYTLKWEGEDADQDTLSYIVEYSPDMGETWQPIAIIEDTLIEEVTIDIKQLTPSRNGIFKVTASDRLHTTACITPKTYCVMQNGKKCNPTKVFLDGFGKVIKKTAFDIEFPHLQVYPNPFSNRTTAMIEMQREAEVSLDIYNIQGNHLRTVLDAKVLSKGKHYQKIQADDLPQGLYLLRMKYGTSVKTVKLMIL